MFAGINRSWSVTNYWQQTIIISMTAFVHFLLFCISHKKRNSSAKGRGVLVFITLNKGGIRGVGKLFNQTKKDEEVSKK